VGESQYRVLFIADERDGVDIPALKKNLSKIFELSADAIDTLFTGLPVVIKNTLDQNTAMNFRTAIVESGGVSWIEEITSGQEEYRDRRQIGRRDMDERRVRQRVYTGKADRRDTTGRRRDDSLEEDEG